MKYFFLAFLVVVAAGGPRGRAARTALPEPPAEFFPDMVRQSKVKPQSPSAFFADGVGPRRPVEGTAPMGFVMPARDRRLADRQRADGKAPRITPGYAFTDGPDYYDTGMMGDQWGTGIPLEVTPALLEKGQRAVHDQLRGVPRRDRRRQRRDQQVRPDGIANYHDPKYLKMADGEIFYTITNGHNSMNGYGANITVRDRWAIVCYVRALQKAQDVQLAELPPAEQDA